MRSFLSRRTVQDADSCDLISFLMLLVAVHGLRMMRTVFGKALGELLCEVFGRSFFSFFARCVIDLDKGLGAPTWGSYVKAPKKQHF